MLLIKGYKHLAKEEGMMGGQIHIKGHRISIWMVIEYIEARWTNTAILDVLDTITLEQLKEVRRYRRDPKYSKKKTLVGMKTPVFNTVRLFNEINRHVKNSPEWQSFMLDEEHNVITLDRGVACGEPYSKAFIFKTNKNVCFLIAYKTNKRFMTAQCTYKNKVKNAIQISNNTNSVGAVKAIAEYSKGVL